MAKKTKVLKLDLHSPAFRKTMKDPKIRKVVEEQLNIIKSKAGPGHESQINEGPTRVRGTVTTESAAARRKESQEKNLTRAFLESKR